MKLQHYRTFADPLAKQAVAFPNKTAFIYLADGEEEEHSLNFRELHERALGLAHRLSSSHRPGDRVLLLLPPGLDYVTTLYGCFYAGVVAVSAPPPNPRRPQKTLNRLLAIAADAEVVGVVTTAAFLHVAQTAVPSEHPLLATEWVAVDEIAGTADSSVIATLDPADIAVLQYTSGSTAHPRGVELTHSNLLDNSRFIADAFGHRFGSDVGFNWIPPFHDMGLIGAVLQPTYCSGLSVLASPTAIVKRPLLWLKGIHRYRARTSGGPDFFYDICTERVRPEDCEGLDLSSWQVAFNGAEPVRAETIKVFAKKFEPFGFRPEAFFPCYGLAEATLMVTAPARNEMPTVRQFDADSLKAGQAIPSERDGGSRLVGCGAANERHRLRIVEPETRIPLKLGDIGEIWVSGPSIAKGYRGASEDVGRIFGAKLEDGDDHWYLRTGDLGFLDGAELFVVGRISDIIVIRGRNHHPHDIEDLAESTAPVLVRHASAAFELGNGRAFGIALVAEMEDTEPSAGRMAIASIRSRVAEDLQLPLVLVSICPMGTVPKTTSGKVQRRLCRSLLLAGELETIAEWRASAFLGSRD